MLGQGNELQDFHLSPEICRDLKLRRRMLIKLYKVLAQWLQWFTDGHWTQVFYTITSCTKYCCCCFYGLFTVYFMWVYFDYTLVCAPLSCPVSTELDLYIRSPGTRVTGNCEPLCGYWELKWDPLEEQQVLLTIKPPHQPQAGTIFTFPIPPMRSRV